jgi:hypothetical protein
VQVEVALAALDLGKEGPVDADLGESATSSEP